MASSHFYKNGKKTDFNDKIQIQKWNKNKAFDSEQTLNVLGQLTDREFNTNEFKCETFNRQFPVH